MDSIDSSQVFKSNARGERDRSVRWIPESKARCELHVLEPRWAAVVRFRAAADQLHRGFFQRYAALTARLARNGRRSFGPPFAIFGRSDDNAVDVEAGFLVEAPVDEGDDIAWKRLPTGLVATLTHVGSYEQIGASYFELLEWLDDRALRRDGPFMEIYLDGPDTVAAREASTRIVIPVLAPERANDVT